MKLKYKISQPTNLDGKIIIDTIIAKLEHNKYRILSVGYDSVNFDESPWKLMWNFQAVRRLEGGRFEVDILGKDTSVSLKYYINLLPQLFVIAALTIGLVANGEYYAPIFFFLFYFVAIMIQTVTLKEVATELLTKITGEIS